MYIEIGCEKWKNIKANKVMNKYAVGSGELVFM